MGFLNEAVDETAARLAAAVQDHFCASRDTYYGLPLWKYFPTKAYKKFAESEETIYE
jgi:ecdysone 20-monooxygenase